VSAASSEPPDSRTARAAALGAHPVRTMTIATRTRPPDAVSARRARERDTRASSAPRRSARSRSFRDRGWTSIIRLPCTRPSRLMLAVVSVFRTSFVAVPALSRVEPASTSGPGVGAITTLAPTPRALAGLHTTTIVATPRRRPAASAPRTNGVTPLADTPTTTSPRRTRRRTARAPARASSSAPSRERNTDERPPAMIA